MVSVHCRIGQQLARGCSIVLILFEVHQNKKQAFILFETHFNLGFALEGSVKRMCIKTFMCPTDLNLCSFGL